KLTFGNELLGPEGARRCSVKKLKDVGDVVTYQLFVPEIESIAKVTRKVLAKESMDFDGAKNPVLKVEEQLEGYPAKRTAWLDREGRVVRQTEPGPFGVTEIVRSDRVTAIKAAAGNQLPEEMYDQTLVRSNIRLPSPRSINRILLRLTQKDPRLGWPDFT